MNSAQLHRPKITVVGMGSVGSTLAYALAVRGLVGEMVLINRTHEKAVANERDLNHGMCFLPHAVIRAGNWDDAADSDVVAICADAHTGPITNRLDLAGKNTALIREIIPPLAKAAPHAVYVVVTNPVDVIAYEVIKVGGFAPRQVMATGTLLDTARLRYIIATHCGISAHDVQGYVLGEHGDSEMIAWSTVTVGGTRMDQYCIACGGKCGGLDKEGIANSVKKVGYEVYAAKGATNFAVCESMVRMIQAVVRDENRVLTVSGMIDDYCGVSDVCLSVPSLVSHSGVKTLLPLQLNDEEVRAFRHSGDVVRSVIRKMGF
jgi:L-lactate dehydrogenase